MEMFAVNQMPYESFRRPNLKDRFNYTIKSTVNTKKTIAKDVLVTTAGVGATLGAATLVKNTPAAQKVLKDGYNWVVKTKPGTAVKGLADKAMPYVTKGYKWVKNLPAPAKAVMAAGLAITAFIAGVIKNKGVYNAGKIDQEFKDISKR